MPHSKDIAGYPVEYWDVAATVRRAGNSLRLPFPQRRAAIGWRARFNAFKSIVRKEGFEAAMMPEEDYRTLVSLQLRIEPAMSGKSEKGALDNPATLVIEHMDFTEAGKALRAAFEAAGVSRPTHRGSLEATPEKEEDEAEGAVLAYMGKKSDPSERGAEAFLQSQGMPQAVRCNECDEEFPCWNPGTRCVRLPEESGS